MAKLIDQSMISTKMTPKQCSDTGQAMVLILLLVAFFSKNETYAVAAIPVLIINMTIPRIFYPVAIVWFGLSNVMGAVVSKVLLSAVYIALVLPVGVLRRLAGKDSMRLKVFKKDTTSVMHVRNHQFTAEDLEKPY